MGKKENEKGQGENMPRLVTVEERKGVLGTLQKISNGEGIDCVHCPCYTSCTRC
ncbi:hypothetical protein KAT95_02575 [Candidatus Parcubacteria bacterium]|nr:hypothetical protein [Candidatus Parcubacteria bacterium]